jgi:hypothetical protein
MVNSSLAGEIAVVVQIRMIIVGFTTFVIVNNLIFNTMVVFMTPVIVVMVDMSCNLYKDFAKSELVNLAKTTATAAD